MKLNRIALGGVFLVALVLGLALGWRSLAHLWPNVSAVALGADGDSPRLTKSVEGTLTTFSRTLPSTWSLDSQTTSGAVISFTVTSDTRIVTNGVQPAVGMWRVELESLPGGLLARAVELQPDPPAVVVEGALTLVDNALPGLWAIDNYLFTVDAATQQITRGLRAEPGTWARVEMIKLTSGAPGQARRYATAVELLRSRTEGGPAEELLDRVRQIDGDAGLWTVGSTQVLVRPSTRVEPAIGVNDLVMVHGQRSTAAVVAETIVKLPPGEEVFFEAIIKAINGVQWQVEARTGRRLSVNVANSIVQGQPAVDSAVQVHGIQVSENVVEAVRVWVVGESEFNTVVGWLQSIEHEGPSALWRVSLLDGPTPRSVYVSLDPDVWVDDAQGRLESGAWLELSAARTGDDMYRAEHVKVLARAPKRVIQGVVENMQQDGLPAEWLVDGYRVSVVPGTAITGNPRVGSFVTVSGVLDYQGVVQAVVITTVVR